MFAEDVFVCALRWTFDCGFYVFMLNGQVTSITKQRTGKPYLRGFGPFDGLISEASKANRYALPDVVDVKVVGTRGQLRP